MSSPTSVNDLDLSPAPGKNYFDFDREFREEFIYFVMVDRFHDNLPRSPMPQSGRSAGFPAPDGFLGGTIKGITDHLDYIAGLGCTAIWLSPPFVTNEYYGYDVTNYLDIDPRFGTKQDLVDLVDAAHARNPPMRIILDVVINHSGNTWEYKGGPKNYSNDTRFDFGQFTPPPGPIPTELRDPEFYHRRGRIVDFNDPTQVQRGDIASLKDYANDDDEIGSKVINTLILAHCYWIREADVDGFRVDAVKHMGPVACSRFCSNVREYAYSLGKRRFFLFGELANSDDEIYDRYIGPNTSRLDGGNTVFFGIDSLLDFRLADGIFQRNIPQFRAIIKGQREPQSLFDRLEAQRNRALNRGELGRYLITFVDNHDGFWQDGRIGHTSNDKQVIASIGYLLCSLGTPVIYYGTEQGFSGASSGGDFKIREGMFDKGSPSRNFLNTDCMIYKEIAAIAKVMRSTEPLRFGRMYFRQLSGNGTDFGLPFGTEYILAFSRILFGREVLVVYNVSPTHTHEFFVIVDADIQKTKPAMKYLYGKTGIEPVLRPSNPSDPTRFVRLKLDPMQFVILE
jgi:alpha-amylase